ncbi:ergothioneine biosynthesis protein EgtB [Candidatus Laterigemmans baculatus]|uniref:ergothioneine biosynthesis protein EgtB n=1 Tax=Candidatus Laterigemmans baculatus TaxID=2770505 RepID=UPI0036F346D9
MRPTPAEALQAFRRVREFSRVICSFLEPEDCVVQSMPEASPIRWHLAHTTWFFETFVLRELQPDYRSPNEQFHYLFNSYYTTLGDPFPRPRRGLLSRPTVAEVWRYRQQVDEAVERELQRLQQDGELQHRSPASRESRAWESLSSVFQTGLQHEQQHQELMLTDIKHAFSCNPLYPTFDPSSARPGQTAAAGNRAAAAGNRGAAAVSDEPWYEDSGGIVSIGHAGEAFAYDNELPRHSVLLQPFRLARTVVTNGQFLEFIEAGGYACSEHWLDAGWQVVQQQKLSGPLYWVHRDGQWLEFTLAGLRPLDLAEPVCHVSFFEADAYARWRGCRLPSEAEWEHVASQWIDEPASYGTFADDRRWHPQALRDVASLQAGDGSPVTTGPRGLFGDVWEWTASPYLGYPGYRPPSGAIGEYNGKFMCNQFVLRGGSVATSRDHLRVTYRNFFPPDARWQFSGIRLAADP